MAPRAEGQAATLETRLERVRRLWGAYSNANDRAVIREGPGEGPSGIPRECSWWAMGEADLAGLVREESAPDSLVKARADRARGRKGLPRLTGREAVRAIVAEIESPDFQLESMSSDAAEPTLPSREHHKNLAALHFRAFGVDLDQRIATARDYNLLPLGTRAADARPLPEARRGMEHRAAGHPRLPPTPHVRRPEAPFERLLPDRRFRARRSSRSRSRVPRRRLPRHRPRPPGPQFGGRGRGGRGRLRWLRASPAGSVRDALPSSTGRRGTTPSRRATRRERNRELRLPARAGGKTPLPPRAAREGRRARRELPGFQRPVVPAR